MLTEDVIRVIDKIKESVIVTMFLWLLLTGGFERTELFLYLFFKNLLDKPHDRLTYPAFQLMLLNDQLYR